MKTSFSLRSLMIFITIIAVTLAVAFSHRIRVIDNAFETSVSILDTQQTESLTTGYSPIDGFFVKTR